MLSKIKRFIAHLYLKPFWKMYSYMNFKDDIVVKNPELTDYFVSMLLRDCREYTMQSVKRTARIDGYMKELLNDPEVNKIGYEVFYSDMTGSGKYADKFWSDRKVRDKSYKLTYEEVMASGNCADKFWNDRKVRDKSYELTYEEVMASGSSADQFWSGRKVRDKSYELTYEEIMASGSYADKFWNDRKVVNHYKKLSKEALIESNAYFEECCNNNRIKKKSLKHIINDDSFFYGGVNKCEYSLQNSLLVTGWFVPVSNYDEIDIYCGEKHLGNAAMGTYRGDIYNHYRFFNEKYSGWEFVYEGVLNLTENDEIIILAKKGGSTVLQSKARIVPIKEEKKYLNVKSAKELLTITKGNEVVEEINFSEMKRIYHQMLNIDNRVRKNGEEFSLKRYIGNDLVSDVPIIKNDYSHVKYEGVDNILAGCTVDTQFYRRYMRGGNYVRIHSDFMFLRQQLSNKHSSILDVGAVPPLLAYLLNSEGYDDITVIDPSVDQFSNFFDANNINYCQGNILKDDLTINRTYDVVIFAEVLEHLTGDILSVIDKLSSYINNGGLLYITTPNQGSISGIYGLLQYQSGLASKYKDTVYMQYERINQNGYYGHIREYSGKEVIQLLEKKGFDLIVQQYIPEYRNENAVVVALEKTYPAQGLFGKYLFQKIDNKN